MYAGTCCRLAAAWARCFKVIGGMGLRRVVSSVQKRWGPIVGRVFRGFTILCASQAGLGWQLRHLYGSAYVRGYTLPSDCWQGMVFQGDRWDGFEKGCFKCVETLGAGCGSGVPRLYHLCAP